MQKMSSTIKQAFIFLVLALTVPWLNMAAFFALLMSEPDEETKSMLEEDSSTIFHNFYHISFFAFILTYIIAKQLINKKTSRWYWRLFWYIITDIVLFFTLCFLPS